MARASSTATDPTQSKDLKEVREEYDFYRQEWQDVRSEAAIDMRYVAGNPWTEDDEEARGDRPTIAPDEMTQYRVQVTNALRKAPRGAKFQPVGRGADQKSAEFYQDKWREIEYRSHGIDHYIQGADNVLQRGYGCFRIDIQYTNPRDVNPDLVIEGFPDPDVVLPDPTHKLRTGLDMKGCFVLETMRRSEFKRKYPKAKVTNFSELAGAGRFKPWLLGTKDIQLAEWWKVETYRRSLRAVVFGHPHPAQPDQVLKSKPIPLFEDEVELFKKARPGVSVLADREVRPVDYPKVVRRLTNGLEILDEQPWPGKYIPIVMMYGPILYVPDGGKTKKHVISMTRFMRDPWKAYCYACSQELEVLGQVPKATTVVYDGQITGDIADEWEDSLSTPKAFLRVKGRVPGMKETEERLPLPQRVDYTQGSYLAAIEEVKEGFRRAIQAAAGSNYLPTQAQRINDKSGKALEAIDEAATQGTWHFVSAYEAAIKAGGIIGEDLMDKVHDYTGETGIMSAKGEAQVVQINDPENKDAYPTAGDHLVTVTTAPSSDSEYDAVEKFIDGLVGSIGELSQILGPPVAAYILSQSIKMRNLGVQGDELADAILPPQFRGQGKDGKPVDPALVAAQQQIQGLQQQLQKLQNETSQKIILERVKGQIQHEIASLKAQATSADKAADRAVKLDVAAIQAKIETMAMFLEELKRIGGLNEDASARLHEAGQAALERSHDTIEQSKNRAHERMTQMAEHAHAHRLAAAGTAANMAEAAQGATLDARRADQDAGNAATLAQIPPPAGPEGAEAGG